MPMLRKIVLVKNVGRFQTYSASEDVELKRYQARNTYGPADLEILVCFAHVAAAVYVAHGGPEFLRSIA